MKQTYVILLSVIMTLSAVDVSAQKRLQRNNTTLYSSGIRIECNAPIDVFVDGVKMCEAVNTCMVANLPRGEYFVEVYEVGYYSTSRPIYSQRVRLNSNMEVKDIVVRSDANGSNYGNYGNYDGNYNSLYLPIMDDATYAQLLARLKETAFSSDKKEIIEMVKINSLFTVEQVKGIAKTMSFDSDRLWALKALYPVIVDREKAFSLQEVLPYSSSKKEFSKFATDYDLQHPMRP